MAKLPLLIKSVLTVVCYTAAITGRSQGSPLWGVPGPVLVYRRPIDAMVDVTNDLGVAVLQNYAYSRSNFAFSPYGVASVLVVLYEGARGESARQIHNALRLPWNRDVTRIGFRDIHRHLRGYFSHEGYLSGLTLNKLNTTLLPEYRRVLRFYGYDVGLTENDGVFPPTKKPMAPTTTTSSTPEEPADVTTMPTLITTAATESEITFTSAVDTTTSEVTFSTALTEEVTVMASELPPPVEDGSTTTALSTEESSPLVTTTTEPSPSTTVPVEETSLPEESASEVTLTTQSSPRTTLPVEETSLPEESASEVTLTTQSSPRTTLPVEETSRPEESASEVTLTTEPPPSTTVPVEETTTKESTVTTSLPEQSTSEVTLTTEPPPSTTVPVEETTTFIIPESTVSFNTPEEYSSPTTVIGTPSQTVTSTITAESSTELTEDMSPTDLTTTTGPQTESTLTESPVITAEAASTDSVLVERRQVDSSENVPTYRPEDLTVANLVRKYKSDETVDTLVKSAAYRTRQHKNLRYDSDEDLYQHLADVLFTVLAKLTNVSSEETGNKIKRESRAGETHWSSYNANTSKIASYMMNKSTEDLSYVPPGNRSRERRSVPDISLQLQNGMFDSQISRGYDLFAPLPKRPFLIDGITEELVPVMSYTSIFPYAYIHRLHAQALEFPLDDERYRLLIIKPMERRGLRQLIFDLSSCSLRTVYEELKPTRVQAVIPSFMVEGFVILTPTLQKLDIWDVFDPRRANLSGMSNDPDLYVRNIEQAVTVVIKNYVKILDIQTRTLAARAMLELFLVTHPFLYFVVDTDTHVALMAGKIVDPLNSRIY